MRKLPIILLLLFFSFQVQGQELDNNTNIEVGTIVEINDPEAFGYKHIHFPRANFIIKRKGVANYNSVKGNRVKITAIKTKNDGTRQVKMKRIDGQKFFGISPTVKANFDKALESEEIIL